MVAAEFQEARNEEREEGEKPKAKRRHLEPPRLSTRNTHCPPLLAGAGWRLEEPTDPGVCTPRLVGGRAMLRPHADLSGERHGSLQILKGSRLH